MLGRLLELAGIDAVILERKSADYVLGRIRAGVLEQGSIDLMDRAQAGQRMHQEGLIHQGIALSFDGDSHRIDFGALIDRSDLEGLKISSQAVGATRRRNRHIAHKRYCNALQGRTARS